MDVDALLGAAMVAAGVVFVVILQLYVLMAGGVEPLNPRFTKPAAQIESTDAITAFGFG